MLVLTRKLQEKIRIGDNVTVTVLRVKGNAVRIGIEAPQDVSILRGEIPRFDDVPTEDASETEPAESMSTDEPAIAPTLEDTNEDDMDSHVAVLPRLTPGGASMIARVEQCIREMELQDV